MNDLGLVSVYYFTILIFCRQLVTLITRSPKRLLVEASGVLTSRIHSLPLERIHITRG
jgi:hypothetical protein